MLLRRQAVGPAAGIAFVLLDPVPNRLPRALKLAGEVVGATPGACQFDNRLPGNRRAARGTVLPWVDPFSAKPNVSTKPGQLHKPAFYSS